MNCSEVYNVLHEQYPMLQPSMSLKVKIGQTLRQMGCSNKHTMRGQSYLLVSAVSAWLVSGSAFMMKGYEGWWRVKFYPSPSEPQCLSAFRTHTWRVKAKRRIGFQNSGVPVSRERNDLFSVVKLRVMILLAYGTFVPWLRAQMCRSKLKRYLWVPAFYLWALPSLSEPFSMNYK